MLPSGMIAERSLAVSSGMVARTAGETVWVEELARTGCSRRVGLRHGIHPDGVAGARPVLDDNGLADLLRHFIEYDFPPSRRGSRCRRSAVRPL